MDGQSAEEYAARLDENLASLLNRATHISKGDGREMRPIGMMGPMRERRTAPLTSG